MQNLYLTELKNSVRSKSNPSRNKTSFDNSKQMRRANSSDRNSNNKNSKNTTELQFLDYLIQEQINFADLEKIESHYKSLIIDLQNEHDYKSYLIQKRKEELRRLEESIEDNLINSFQFSREILDNFYEKITEDLKNQIKHKSYDIECYSNLKTKLYKSNVFTILQFLFKFYFSAC